MKNELKILRALADETRLNIIKFLLNGEKCVCEIFPYIKRTQSTTSIQLDVLKKAGIVDSRREGKKVYYFVSKREIEGIFKSLGHFNTNLMGKSNCCRN